MAANTPTSIGCQTLDPGDYYALQRTLLTNGFTSIGARQLTNAEPLTHPADRQLLTLRLAQLMRHELGLPAK